MDIESLKMTISEAEGNALLAQFAPPDLPVENLRMRLTPAGVAVLGDYPTLFMKMSFETLWEVSGQGSQVRARLASVKVAGLPAGVLRGVLLKSIRDAVAREPALQVEEEEVRVDLSRLAVTQRLNLRLHLTRVQCGGGVLTIEAAAPVI